MKRSSKETDKRIEANLKILDDANESANDAIRDMLKIKEELEKYGWHDYTKVHWFFQENDYKKLVAATGQPEAMDKVFKKEDKELVEDNDDKFENTG